MRSLVFAALLAASASADAASKSVLILIDGQAAEHLGDLTRQYRSQLHGEGWTTKLQYFPRWTGSFATNDWPGINRISNYIAQAGCACVQFIGSPPPVMTGGHNYDGHPEHRRMVSYWPYACTNLTYTDNTSWNMEGTVQGYASLIATNNPGDGIPDQTYGMLAYPLCILNATRLTAGSDNFPSGYLAGQLAQTSVPEGDALRRYMTNNLAYRRSLSSFPATGQIVASSWLNYSTVVNSNTLVTISANSSYAGVTNGWLYAADYMATFCPAYVTAGGVWSRFFWVNTYKSYCMEDANGEGYYRRFLFNTYTDGPVALVSSWCMGANSAQFFWLARSGDQTVADAIRSSVARYGVLDFGFPLAGDVTLPLLSSQTIGPKPLVTTVDSLTVNAIQ